MATSRTAAACTMRITSGCGDWWDEDPYSSEYNQFVHVPCGTTPRFSILVRGLLDRDARLPLLGGAEDEQRSDDQLVECTGRRDLPAPLDERPNRSVRCAGARGFPEGPAVAAPR
jgi:hypothetical protein